MSFPGFIPFAGAIAILLSVIVRWIRSGVSWGAIEDGVATADNIREVTGIMGREALQKAFGPARLEDGIYPVSRREVLRQRTAVGYLLGDRWLDGASAAIAILALLPIYPLWGTRPWVETLLLAAGVYQIVGWVAVIGLFGKR